MRYSPVNFRRVRIFSPSARVVLLNAVDVVIPNFHHNAQELCFSATAAVIVHDFIRNLHGTRSFAHRFLA